MKRKKNGKVVIGCSIASAAIIVISITLISKKGILQNYLEEVRQLKQQ